MIPQDPFVSDSSLNYFRSLVFKFHFKIQDNKLLIQARSPNEDFLYQAIIFQTPNLSLNQIQKNLQNNNFVILSKSQDHLNLKIYQTNIELFSMSKLEINQLKQNFKDLNQLHQLLRNNLENKIEEVRRLKEKMETIQIQQLKHSIKKSIENQEQFRIIVQSQNDGLQNVKDEMKDFKLQIRNLTKQIKNMNQQMKFEVQKITSQIKKIQEKIKTSDSSMKDFHQVNKQQIKIKEVSQQNIKEEMKNIKFQFQNLIQRIQIVHKEGPSVKQQIKKNEDEIKKKNEPVVNQFNKQINQQKCQIKSNLYSTNNQKNQLSTSKLVNKFNMSIAQLNQQKTRQILNQNSKRYSTIIKGKIQYKWSQELKSIKITIDNKYALISKQSNQLEFCLLDVAFSKIFKQKQSWAIRINNNKNGIFLGICLKSKMQKYNFNSKNIKWFTKGHGLHVIESKGDCYSHSDNEFNEVRRCFAFCNKDVIVCEYDPIQCKLRFIKNNMQKFEMPIDSPPQNDHYYPCIALREQNESVELLTSQQLH